jgi:hypothetical protein
MLVCGGGSLTPHDAVMAADWARITLLAPTDEPVARKQGLVRMAGLPSYTGPLHFSLQPHTRTM